VPLNIEDTVHLSPYRITTSLTYTIRHLHQPPRIPKLIPNKPGPNYHTAQRLPRNIQLQSIQPLRLKDKSTDKASVSSCCRNLRLQYTYFDHFCCRICKSRSVAVWIGLRAKTYSAINIYKRNDNYRKPTPLSTAPPTHLPNTPSRTSNPALPTP